MTLNKAAAVGEWTTFHDVLHSQILAEQHYALIAYLPFTGAAFHLLFAGNDSSPMRWPRQQSEAEFSLKHSESVLAEWMQGLTPTLVRFITPRMARLDVVRTPAALEAFSMFIFILVYPEPE